MTYDYSIRRKFYTLFSLLGIVLTLVAWVCSYLPTKPEILWGSAERNNGFGLYRGDLQFIMHAPLEAFGGGIAEDIKSLHLSIVALFFAGSLSYCVFPAIRRSSRKRKGMCADCGYDLRGSSSRCPECGRKFRAPNPVANESRFLDMRPKCARDGQKHRRATDTCR